MSVNKLQAALATATNEVTVAAANLNFDFTLVKYEAPKEFQPLGESLSLLRKNDAEHGTSHVTARRLGALFEGISPATPNLLKAYGTRASEISKAAGAKVPKDYAKSIFAEYTGIDGTNIWAAATSSGAAIYVHLLSCILARLFKPPEATAAWVELVKERRKEISTRLENGEVLSFGLAAAAAQQEISRTQLADWDASARAWLQSADSIKESQQKKLDLILKNIHVEVNQEQSAFPSIISAWKIALQTMESLVTGMPQAVHDGAALLGLSAWHLYPDMTILGTKTIDLRMSDPLINPGGVLTVGFRDSINLSQPGVHWSLSLAHLRYYGPPVNVVAELTTDMGRITFTEFIQCVLGAILERWNIYGNEMAPAMRLMIAIAQSVQISPHRCSILERCARKILESLGNAASIWLHAEGEEKEVADRLTKLGSRRHSKFFSRSADLKKGIISAPQMPFFGLLDWQFLLESMVSTEVRIRFLRQTCLKIPGLAADDVLIRYYQNPYDSSPNDNASFATALPRLVSPLKRKRKSRDSSVTVRHCRWTTMDMKRDDEDIFKLHNHNSYGRFRYICRDLDFEKVGDDGTIETFSFVVGHPKLAGLFIARSALRKLEPQFILNTSLTNNDIQLYLESGILNPHSILIRLSMDQTSFSRTLLTLSVAEKVYKMIPEAKINVEVFEGSLIESRWAANLWSRFGDSNVATSSMKFESNASDPDSKDVFSMLAFFESGNCDVDPKQLGGVIALSSADALYIDMKVGQPKSAWKVFNSSSYSVIHSRSLLNTS
jgi:hypothetical protein